MVITPVLHRTALKHWKKLPSGLKETSFMEEGGETFDCIPCLNDQIGGIDMLAAICRGDLHGWIKF